MEKRKIGSLDVSAVGMGCMGFSHGYGQIPERSYSIEAIQKAFDAGCNFFDTAEAYGKDLYWEGHNEEILGEALKDIRDQAVIATKFHLKDEDLEAYEKGEKLYDIIRAHLDASLKRLQTDYVDLYYLHRIHENIPVEEVAKVMGQLKREGLIKEWGLSQVGVDTIDRAHHAEPLGAVQNLYSILERGVEEEVFPYLIEHGIALVPFSPIASGFLSGKVKADTQFAKVDDVRNFVPQLSKENIVANQPILDVISEFAEAKDATNAQISLAWMLKKYPNVIPIPGSKNQERILENLGGGDVNLTDEEFARLQNALDQCEVYGHRGFEESQHQSFSKNWRQDEQQ